MAAIKLEIMMAVMVVAYLAVIAWYLKATVAPRKRKKTKRAKSRSRAKHRSSGKNCPGCNEMIDKRRTVCQHCGHKFDVPPGIERHPDEVKAGIPHPPGGQDTETGKD